LDVEPSDAEIVVDGEILGTVAELMTTQLLPLEPGIHQIVIRKEGFRTWRAEVAVKEEAEVVRVRLEPQEE
jgi:hypothetical protein